MDNVGNNLYKYVYVVDYEKCMRVKSIRNASVMYTVVHFPANYSLQALALITDMI